jgi:hypothetical protein
MHVVAAYLERELDEGESVAMADGLTLTQETEGSVSLAMAKIGKALERLGGAMANGGRKFKAGRVKRTTDIVQRVILKSPAPTRGAGS